MSNQRIIYFTLIISISLLLFSSLFIFSYLNKRDDYVVFAEHEHLNDSLRNALLARLENHDIEYVIDAHGHIQIREKDLEKAVQCCS